MALSDDFKEAVLQNKKIKVRIMMKDNLLLDSTGVEFDEMLNFALKSDSELIDQHDGEIFKPSDEWNEDYLNDQMVAVVNNFSAERIDLLKKMVKKLYVKSNELNVDKERTVPINNHDNVPNECVSPTKAAGGIVIALGAGTILYGIVAETPIIVPVIGGAVIMVGVFLLSKKKQ